MPREVKDYSEDDTTQTLSIITDVTEHDCLVSEREYTYIEDDDPTLEVKQGVEIILETLSTDDDPVYRSLEELRQEAEQDVEFDI
jgi:hypothetical protein